MVIGWNGTSWLSIEIVVELKNFQKIRAAKATRWACSVLCSARRSEKTILIGVEKSLILDFWVEKRILQHIFFMASSDISEWVRNTKARLPGYMGFPVIDDI